ncbi:TPA: hypothetical protein N0F65_010629 [Lagenidium giganteum]|uniref:MARVEL domain-containing protein n=1 Tax=Lagenidium giganteum TaxID=4803 RepID=A0AAV2ZCD3_9STRA|nr:TPA: hypothetical protein N0F65_010629 [Lagenidium giganteum]
MRGLLQPHHDKHVQLVLRVVQTLCALIAMALFCASFKGNDVIYNQNGERVVISVYWGGPTVTFGLLVTFASFVFGLIWILIVHVKDAVRPPPEFSIIVDAILAVLLLSAGAAMAASDYTRYCDVFPQSVSCSRLQAGVVFCFLAFVANLALMTWTAYLMMEKKKQSRSCDPSSMTFAMATENQQSSLNMDSSALSFHEHPATPSAQTQH